MCASMVDKMSASQLHYLCSFSGTATIVVSLDTSYKLAPAGDGYFVLAAWMISSAVCNAGVLLCI